MLNDRMVVVENDGQLNSVSKITIGAFGQTGSSQRLYSKSNAFMRALKVIS